MSTPGDDLATRIRHALTRVQMPDDSTNIVEAGIVSPIHVSEGKAVFALEIDSDSAQRFEGVRTQAQEIAQTVNGISSAFVALTARKTGKGASNDAPAAPASKPQARAEPSPAKRLDSIEHIIAVASGKGGVGKSTTCANLAMTFAAMGKQVGVLDADIYGPSMPTLFGVHDKPGLNSQKQIIPLETSKIKLMSLGLMLEEDMPVVWRAPMIVSALKQMLFDVEWGKLDLLLIDMPPGTGDVQLTMAQSTAMTGAIIVSTPQDLALIDARKGANMFHKVSVPVLGLVENMAGFACPNCGTVTPIFGENNMRKEAQRIGASLLGQVPLTMNIRRSADSGCSLDLLSNEENAAYQSIAGNVLRSIA